MSSAGDFLSWALDAARTNDELYTVELMVDSAWSSWCHRHGRPYRWDWDAIHAHQEEQRLNPAYRASIPREKIEALVEIWTEPVNHFSASGVFQRPLTDLTALRFFPTIKALDLTCRLTDIAPLAAFRGLQSLSLREDELSEIADFSPLAGLPELTSLRLDLKTPWPDVSALGTLPKLKSLTYHGNVLALRCVTRLSTVNTVEIETANGWETPLRDLRELPEMPRVRHLKVKRVAYLDGVERFPACNLQLAGPFADLGPLAGHSAVTWLQLDGERFFDLGPLARMPALREVRLERERPLDVTPLAEAPVLREAAMPRCRIVATELASINALLQPWADDFAMPEPRKLGPLRFFFYDLHRDDWTARAKPSDPRPEFYGDDRAYAAAESRWFRREFNRRVDKLLRRGWREMRDDDSGTPWSTYHPGNFSVNLKRYEDTIRLREIISLARELLSTTRFPWEITFFVEPHGNLDDDMDEIARREGDEDEFDAESEREDWEDYRQYQKERQAFLEREHRLRLQQELGGEINPDEYSPQRDAKKTAPDESAKDGGTDDSGDVATAEPARDKDDDDAAADADGDSLGEDLSFMLKLNEAGLWVVDHQREDAAYFYGEAPEDWHALPEPPSERPSC